MYFRVSGAGRATVMLLHDYFGTHGSWTAQRTHLSRYFVVVTPDLRGHGRSVMSEGHLSVSTMAEDVIATLDHLEVESAHLIGCSHGAVIALHAARMMRDRVDSIVVTSVPDIGDPNVVSYGKNYATAVFPRLEPEFNQMHGNREPGYTRDVLLASFEADLESPPQDHLDAVRLAGEIDCPALVLGGDRDPVMAPERALKLAQQIPSAHLGILPDTGHLAHQESPALYNEAVLDHLWRVSNALPISGS
jgi:pimeloyl-ACP methyl ester carboxylesterase